MIRFLQANINHSGAAQDLLLREAAQMDIDVLIVSEQHRNGKSNTWIPDISSRAAVYTISRRVDMQDTGKGNGFAMARVSGIRVYACYYSPNATIVDFLRELSELEDSITREHGEVLVAGDFNAKSADWGSSTTDVRGRALADMAARLNLLVLNQGTRPTFQRSNSESIIDITLASEGVTRRAVGWTVLGVETLSDHNYISFAVRVTAPSTLHEERPQRAWSVGKLNLESFVEAIKMEYHLMRIPDNAHGDECAGRTIRAITRACDASMPRTGKSRRPPVYWWTDEVAERRRECIAARRILKRTRRSSPDYEDAYKVYSRSKGTFRQSIKCAKAQCWKQLCASVEQDPWGRAYKIVTNKLARHQSIPGIRDPTFARRVVETLFPKHDPIHQEITGRTAPAPPPFTIAELRSAVRLMKSRKSPGPDGLPSEILRLTVTHCPEILLEAFNRCLALGEFPARWKRQRLVLLPKGSKPLDEPSSFRPLCLLDTTGKLLERLLLARLETALGNAEGLSNRQYGFRKGRSTIDAISAVDRIATEANGVNSLSTRFCALATVDVRNAFNSAGWKHINGALERHPGIPEYLKVMVRSYLDERLLYYDTIEGRKAHKVTAGVPQGSVLGPLLWNLMYDDLLRLETTEGTTIIGFADDVGIVVEASTTTLLEVRMNDSLTKVEEWLTANGLEAAAHKTECVLLTRKRLFTPPVIYMGGHRVELSQSIRYLGVQMDSKLRYTEHVTKAAAKAAGTATALSRIMANIGGPRQQKRLLLNTVIHSVLLYGAPVWVDALNIEGTRRKMASVQRQGALRVVCAYRTVSEGAVLVLAGTPPIQLLALERKRMYEGRNNAEKNNMRKEAKKHTMLKWQDIWDGYPKGRWTHRLIPRLEPWCSRQHGEVNYHLTQALTGHGCFGAYLHRIGRKDTDACTQCGAPQDDAEHTIMACPVWSESRHQLEAELRTSITPDNITAIMLSSNSGWDAVEKFLTHVIRSKESERRGQVRRIDQTNDGGSSS